MNESLPKLWLTRSLPAAYKSAEAWAKKGCACAISPLLTIAPPKAAPPLPPKNAVLIFTSSHGVSAFTDLSDSRAHTVITVGDATAATAHAAGFENVTSANGTSEDVTALALKTVPKSTSIIHASAEDVRGRIIEGLLAAGYNARRDIYYRSERVSALPPRLNIKTLSYIALYSPKAAETLAGFAPDLSGVTIISISAATDAALGDIKTQARLIAAAPNETAMLALLKP